MKDELQDEQATSRKLRIHIWKLSVNYVHLQ